MPPSQTPSGNQSENLSPSKEAVESFLGLAKPDGDILLFKIPAPTDSNAHPIPQAMRFEAGSPIEDAVDWACGWNRRNCDIYWQPNDVALGITKKPSVSDITACHFLHVDCDVTINQELDPEGFNRAVEAVLSKLKAFEFTFVIASGGGAWGMFQLKESTERFEDVRALNQHLIDQFDGDASCKNIDRMVRLPGTINWAQSKSKIEKGRRPSLAKVVSHSADSRPELEQFLDYFKSKPTAPKSERKSVEFGAGDPRAAPRFKEQFQSALFAIDPKPLTYDEWRDVMFAVKDSRIENAKSIFIEWCKQDSARFDEQPNGTKWDHANIDRQGGVTYRTVFDMAKKTGDYVNPISVSVEDVGDMRPIDISTRKEIAGEDITIKDIFGDAPGFCDYLYAGTEYLQVPESSIAMCHLSGISAVLSKRVVFDNSIFTQPPQIWVMSLLPTGGRKSEIIDLVRKPMMNVIYGREMSRRIEELNAQIVAFNVRLEALEEGDEDGREMIRAQVDDLLLRSADFRGMVVSDTTEAGLQIAMGGNQGIAFICDGEAAALHNAISPGWVANGAQPQTTTWLNAFSGKDILVNRAGRGNEIIRDASLSICLAIQTGSPTAYLFENAHLRDSGFMARFLIDHPHFKPEDIKVNVARPGRNYNRIWVNFIREYMLPGLTREPQVIHFEQDAAQRFLAFREMHQKEFRPGGANMDLREFHSKVHGTMTRVAGLIAAARAFETNQPLSFTVEDRDVVRTLDLFPKFVNHIRSAFGMDSVGSERYMLLRALHRAYECWPGGYAFSARDLQRRIHGCQIAELRAAIDGLVEYQWLIPTDRNRWLKRDPTVKFTVNPQGDVSDAPKP